MKQRIPEYRDPEQWMRAMQALGLMFHPDDDPSGLVLQFGVPVFSEEEVKAVRHIMVKVFEDCEDPYEIAVRVVREDL